MPLADKYPTQITEEDLIGLINIEPEGKLIDYKRDFPALGDSKNATEFLYDVSSFANTQGGYLIFGIEEKGGLPTKIVGCGNIDPDKEILRIEEKIRDGIRPPISGVESASVRLASGGVALIMRIPKSWNAPHQVIYQKAFRFYARASKGKYQIDVDELRSLFSLSMTAADNINQFRIDRISKIISKDTPAILHDGAKMITHVVPLSAFTGHDVIDLDRALHDRSNLDGMLQSFGSVFFNIDGLLLTKALSDGSRYLQVFRNGCIEIITDFTVEASERRALPSPAFERSIIVQVGHAIKFFANLGVAPPVIFLLTLTSMQKWQIAAQSENSIGKFDRDPLFMPELMLKSFGIVVQDEVKPLLDVIWNAAGSPRSPNYQRNGKRKINEF